MTLTRFWHESGNQFTEKEVEAIYKKYGHQVLLGGDPGWGEDFGIAMASVDFHGCYKHVYLTGPGMMEWSEEERQEIRTAAKSVGIDVSKSDWQDKWFKQGGWEKKVHEWFKNYDSSGFYSAEIDNLDAIWDQSPDEYVKFIRRFDEFLCDNKLTIKLMVKNLSERQLQALIDYDPRPELLCEWGMFEAGSGDPGKQTKLAAKLRIQAVTPLNGLRNTNNYGTSRNGIPYQV